MTRILLLRPGALGDLLLTTRALVTLRAQLENAHITLAGHAGGVELLRQSGPVDTGIAQDDPSLLELFMARDDARLPTRSLGLFDFAVAWMADSDGIVAKNLARLCTGQAIVTPSTPTVGSGVHVSDYLLGTLSPLGIEPTWTSFRLRLAEEAKAWSEQVFQERFPAGKPVVALHVGSGSARKNWSPLAFAATMDILADEGVSPLLIVGPADEAQARSVLSASHHSPPVFREFTLSRLAALLARSDAYLGNDSGVTHLAGLAGVPVVALFGPTDPRMWGPRGGEVTILRWGGAQGDLPPEVVARTLAESFKDRPS